MKNTIKLLFVVVLFCATVSAEEGNMGNGGKTCTSNCLAANQTTTNDDANSVIKFIQNYLVSIFG